VAEYYFTKGLYAESIELFTKIINKGNQTAAIYQKLGFAHAKSNQIENALDAYLKADMILPDDVWTIRKIAQSYRLMGKFEKALEHYRHLEFLQPGKLNPLLQAASCLTSLGKYPEALKLYQDLEKSDPENEKIWKAVAFCAFLSGNLFQADYYAEKLISINSDYTDLFLAGHIAFCQKKNKTAFNFYRDVLTQLNYNIELLIEYFENDSDALQRNGISKDEILLMIDELQYFIDII
jgi:tetratricopeptide (TPR) repeat protein